MKKVLSLAAAGILAAGAAQAGNITVANSDITLYGGVSAGYEWNNNDLAVEDSNNKYYSVTNNKDHFRVNTFAVGLMKKADENSPIGFNAAFASFQVPTVIASTDVVNEGNGLIGYGKTTDFKPWLGYVTIAPIQGLSIDAGLLWSKYGERPLTILNPNINRGALFVLFNPVLFAGARVNYDAGIAKVYIGYNDPSQGLTLAGKRAKDGIEAGATLNVENVKVGLHTYNEAAGRDIYTLCLKSDFGILKGGLQFSYLHKDDSIKDKDSDNNMYGVGLNFNIDLLDAQIADVTFPIRIEYVNTDDKKDDTLWTFTITPTWKPTKNTFARVELAYAKWNNHFVKVDKSSDNLNAPNKDTRLNLAFEAGFLF